MLGGYTYFSQAQVMFVYLRLNGKDDESQKYLDMCLEDAKVIERNFNKMKSPEEINISTFGESDEVTI